MSSNVKRALLFLHVFVYSLVVQLIFLNKLLTEDGRVGCNSVRLIPSTFNEGCVSSVEEKATAIARILHCVVKR